jgi:hypothetical protein
VLFGTFVTFVADRVLRKPSWLIVFFVTFVADRVLRKPSWLIVFFVTFAAYRRNLRGPTWRTPALHNARPM